ncbi:ketopantoate reductase family protein [Psychrobacillus vulpis]|uniref:2-dehydropantoate 2-reductase n=1 Tax=Psychrobacillus vulpis TaxID=2325572 RepID=A0A544TK37_9BACI|nr:2-dehydropantoate 2-reductase [Psychrobacillus vulpis]TQR17825.1 2-dehydropantoate 2-reductase [Psychrobacillus vulpis]
MKIGIIGAGAIGMLFGAYLAEAKHEVTFLVRKNNENEKLYIEKKHNAPKLIHCKQVSEIELLESMDLIIVAVKYHHLGQLKVGLDSLPKQTPLLFIQNGLLHLSYVEQLKQETIAIGSVLHGASKVNPTTVSHLGIGLTTVGILKGLRKKVDMLIESSSDMFPIQFTSNIEQILFRKALLNCLINPLTTIAKVQNGELIKNESYFIILRNMYDELMGAFEGWQELLTWEDVVELCKQTEYNRSSMLADYEKGRLMEIDTIVGAVIGEARKRDKILPVLNTFYLLLQEMNKVGDCNY